MLDFSKRLRELTGKATTSVAEGLNELRANIGEGARVVGGAAKVAAGTVARSTSLTASGIETLTGNKPQEKPVVDTDAQETMNAQKMQRATGYASDELGNRKERLPLSERLEIAKESPGTINELLDEEERKLIQIETVDDKNFFDKAKRVLSGQDKEVKVTVPFEPRPAMIEVMQPEIPDEQLQNVPEEYKGSFSKAIRHLNRFSGTADPEGRVYDDIKAQNLVSKIAAEGNWNPTAGNKERDYGMTQLNKGKRDDLRDPKTAWGKSWKNNFEAEQGPFNEDNPEHQMLGASIVLAVNRQKLTDAFNDGELKRKPTEADIFVAYNMDYKQVADAINGKDYSIQITDNEGRKVKKSLQQQYQDYLNALKSKGFTE